MMTDSKTADRRTCAYCYLFYPCPCGECSYGICGNTKSRWLHEYVHEDMRACNEQKADYWGDLDDR